MTNNLLRTYKFYSRRGNKLSIFGWFNTHTDTLTVWTFTTSLKDKWSKEEAIRLFEQFVYHDIDEINEANPSIIKIKTDAYNSRNAFMHFCNTSYFSAIIV